MQIVIEVDRRLLVRLGMACALGAFVLGVRPGGVFAGPLTVPNTFTANTVISASDMNANFDAIEAESDAQDARIAALEALLADVSRVTSGTTDTIVFAGLNVQIHNGAGSTASANGAGNLMLGYNENTLAAPRTGSHNLVVGDEHGYASYAGALIGSGHSVSGTYGVAIGGSGNTVTGTHSAQLGGRGMVIDDTVGATENGDHTTNVGGLNGEYSEDDGASLGTGAAIADLGLDAAVTYVGDGSASVDIGWGSSVSLGGSATNLNIGFGATNVVVGANANDVQLGTSAGQVAVGSSVPGFVMVGQEANDVAIGNWASNGVTIGWQAGKDSGTGTVVGTGSVAIGGESAGDVMIAQQTSGNVYIGTDALTVDVGTNANQCSLGNGAGANGGTGLVMVGQEANDVALGNWAKNGLSLGYEAGWQNGSSKSVSTGAGNITLGDDARGFVNLGMGAGAVYQGP